MISKFIDILRTPSVHFLLGAALLGGAIYLALGATPNFDHRAIGITVLLGQNAAARNTLYILSVLSGICIFLAFFLRSSVVERNSPIVDTTTNSGVILGIVLASNLLLYSIYSKPVFLLSTYVLFYLALTGIIIHVREQDRHLRDFRWTIVALVYHIVLTGYCLAGESPRFGLNFFALLTLVLLLANLTYEKASSKYKGYSNLIAVSNALWPFMLLPMAIIIANEAQYTLQARFSEQVPGLTLWLVCFMLVSIWGFSNYRRSRASSDYSESGPQLHRHLVCRYLPLVIATNVAFTEYSAQIDFFRIRDFFHGGESLVPIQQLLQFGAMPFIDFYPPHGLFDMLPQLLYQIVNQTAVAESILWGEGYFLGWLPRMLAALLVYWFLGRFLGFKTAFITLFALPTYHMIHPYYTLLLIPAMLLVGGSKTFLQWLIFWIVIFCLVLWRIDFGLAVLAASAFVLAAQSLSERSLTMPVKATCALLLVCTTLALAFIVLSFAKQHSPMQLAQQIVNYVQIQTPTVGLGKIVSEIDVMAALQYILLPLVGITYLAYFSALALNKRALSGIHRVLAFLSVCSLIISIRSLNRHSHYEGVFNPYFFTLIAALIPVMFLSLSKTTRAAIFLMICVASYALFPRSTSLFQIAYYEMGIEKEYPFPATSVSPIALLDAAPASGRLASEHPGSGNIVYFLRNFLRDNETFYDFANAPLLYALAEKKLPGFIMETLYHTSEVGQRTLVADLDRLYQKNELPLVLFRQNNGWDKIDGVDTEVRSYRVAEYIYQRFVPCVNIDNYEVWLSKRLLRGEDCPDYVADRLSQAPTSLRESMHPVPVRRQSFDLIKLPYVWANFDEFDVIAASVKAQELRVIPQQGDAANAFRLQLPDQFQKRDGNYIHLRILSAQAGRMQLVFAEGNRLSFDLIAGDQPIDYLIRISTQYAWHRDTFDHLDINANVPYRVLHAAVLPGD